MALSSQLMSPSVEDKDSVAKTLNHKSAAIQLYREALSHSETRNLGLLDTLLILVTLEVCGPSFKLSLQPGLSRCHRPPNPRYRHGAYTLWEPTTLSKLPVASKF